MIAIHDNLEGYVAHVALKIYINDAKLIFGKQEKYIANCNVLIEVYLAITVIKGSLQSLKYVDSQ